MDTLINYCGVVEERLKAVPGGMKAAKPWEEFALYVLSHKNADEFQDSQSHMEALEKVYANDRIWSEAFKSFKKHFKNWIKR